jgi:hypothetical protein
MGDLPKRVPPKFHHVTRDQWVKAIESERKFLDARPGSLNFNYPYPGLKPTIDSNYLGQDPSPKDRTTYREFCADWGQGPLSWATADGLSFAELSVATSRASSVSVSGTMSRAGSSTLLSMAQAQRVSDAARDIARTLVADHVPRRRGWSGCAHFPGRRTLSHPGVTRAPERVHHVGVSVAGPPRGPTPSLLLNL